MLTYDDGVLAVCDLVNISPPGAMPVQQLQKKSEHFFSERTVSYTHLLFPTLIPIYTKGV